MLGGPVTKDQLTIALRDGRQVLPSMYLLGNLAGHNNNYTNKIKFQLFIGSGKVRFLDTPPPPTPRRSSLSLSYREKELTATWTGGSLLLSNVNF